jgi:hypothetical protein
VGLRAACGHPNRGDGGPVLGRPRRDPPRSSCGGLRWPPPAQWRRGFCRRSKSPDAASSRTSSRWGRGGQASGWARDERADRARRRPHCVCSRPWSTRCERSTSVPAAPQ